MKASAVAVKNRDSDMVSSQMVDDVLKTAQQVIVGYDIYDIRVFSFEKFKIKQLVI